VYNARKHADGAPIHVVVQQQGAVLVAAVQDEGPGFDMNAISSNYAERGSLGIINMQDRARLVEGNVVIDSAPGQGTRVRLTVPLTQRRTSARSNGERD
jgi:signal transduction histidine kinase